jgi:hypothetical protein
MVSVEVRGVQVRIDNRARLLSALLALTSWPNDEQARKPHGTHAHARGTRRLVQHLEKHPAVLILQALLDRGMALEPLFGYMLGLEWPALTGAEPPTWLPPTFPRHLANFYQKSGLETWWEDEAPVWNACLQDAESVLGKADLCPFLLPFVGEFSETLVFIPNISYPTDSEVGVLVDDELCCIAPPLVAWGDNPPWPYNEDPAYLFRGVVARFGSALMRRYLAQHPAELAKSVKKKLPVSRTFLLRHDTWEAQFLALFEAGLVAIYLEDHVSKTEAQAYILMEKKAQGLEELPGVISVLRRYLSGYADGQYAEFADYLPYFAQHLRVAKTITAL